MRPQDEIASPAAVAGELHREQALEKRLEGKTYRAIAAEMGLTVSTVHEHVKRALDELKALNAEKAAEVRSLEVARLDSMLEKLWPKRDEARVADTILRISQRRSDLLGLDAPKNIWLAGDRGGPIQTQDTPVVPLTESERLTRLQDIGLHGFAAATNGNGNGNGDHRSN